MEPHFDRPASLYDNLRPGGRCPPKRACDHCRSLHSSGTQSVGNLTTVGNGSGGYGQHRASIDRAKSPSQANWYSTTVPQNMGGATLGGRHTPTRSSLRHSRMIVLTRNGSVAHKHRPAVVRSARLGSALAGLQTLVGAAVLTVASWLHLASPSLPPKDLPLWSGTPLLLSGLLGLILLCCCRKDYPGYPLSCCLFSFKVTSLTVTTLAGVACFCAVSFAGIHLLSLWRMTCEPQRLLDSTSDSCLCRSNHTLYLDERPYPDLSCPEVENLLILLLEASAIVNLLGGLLAGWYLYLHWSSRYAYVYSQVRTNDHRPMVISNKL